MIIDDNLILVIACGNLNIIMLHINRYRFNESLYNIIDSKPRNSFVFLHYISFLCLCNYPDYFLNHVVLFCLF